MYILTSFFIFTFWMILLLLLYCFLGYPLLLGALGIFKRKSKQERLEYLPKVSLVILAGNDSKTIAAKLDNTALFEYPKEKLEIIVATINSTDGTRKIVEDYFAKGVKLLYQAEKNGRNAALNSCVAEAEGEVIVITDAASVIERYSIKNIVRHFAAAGVGLVAGNIDYTKSNDKFALGEKFFLEHNRVVLSSSSKLKKISRVNPELYALRKSYFCELKDDGILDSTSVPVMYSALGKSCIFEPLALATKAPVSGSNFYMTGKVDSTVASLRELRYVKELFLSREYLLLLHLVSNNLLQSAYGVLLLLLFLVNLLILVKLGYVVLLSLQFLFYVAGLLQLFGYFPYYMVFTSYAHVAGLLKFLKRKEKNAKN